MPSVKDTLMKTALTLAVLLPFASVALAGPPLVCRPFDIGDSTSLPWTHDNGWRGERADYDVTHLTRDTVALLTPTTPIMVRMETLRRAAVYASHDPRVANDLLTTVMARARKADDVLALFDAGYLAETYKQLGPISPNVAALAASIDGYDMVRRSLTARKDPAIEFAAALMTNWKGDAHAQHAERARAGIKADQLLARNIEQLN
jgi:hypothetical protein